MKKFVKVLGISLLVILIVAIILFAVGYIIIKNYMETIKAVVVKVNDNSMLVMGITDNLSGLMSVGFTDEGNIGYKQGQKISFKYNGSITDMYPPSLDKVDKIKITKEKSDVEIPESILRYCYSSTDNVNVIISELTGKGMSITIEDTNEYPYNLFENYIIRKKVKNENYTGVGQKIGEDTENSTSGFTRYRN